MIEKEQHTHKGMSRYLCGHTGSTKDGANYEAFSYNEFNTSLVERQRAISYTNNKLQSCGFSVDFRDSKSVDSLRVEVGMHFASQFAISLLPVS